MNEKVISQEEKYLLILPCSKRKKTVSKAPALELYDGPFYRVLRKNMLTNLDVLILSAKYGLISPNNIIYSYDQKMTVERAKELSTKINMRLSKILKENQYKEIFINLGKTYALALARSGGLLNNYTVYWASGQMGERSHQLKRWLVGLEQKRVKN